MKEAMWFLLGLLCGGAVTFFCLPRGKCRSEGERADGTTSTPPKAWVETRNFLYYDGTEMPVVKEEKNEQ